MTTLLIFRKLSVWMSYTCYFISVILAYRFAGFYGALLTFFLPFIAQFYWAIRLFRLWGWNHYVALITTCSILWLITAGCAILLNKKDRNLN